MKKFMLGISIFWYGAVGSLLTYAYTLLHQSTLMWKKKEMRIKA